MHSCGDSFIDNIVHWPLLWQILMVSNEVINYFISFLSDPPYLEPTCCDSPPVPPLPPLPTTPYAPRCNQRVACVFVSINLGRFIC